MDGCKVIGSDAPQCEDIDGQLLQRWRGGDVVAGDRLARRHYHRLARYFARRFDGDVGDLVQRTWLVIIEARERIQQPGNFAGFYLGVAKNVYREEVRRRVRPILQLEDRIEVGHAPSPEEQLETVETHERLQEALGALGPKLGNAIRPYYFESTTAGRVGEQLGIPESTTRSRLRRAKEFLRARLT